VDRPRTLLLVDDSPDDVTLTLWAFKKCHLDAAITVARDGVEALALLLPTDGSAGLDPCIVLLDINMPKIGGLQVLHTLRQHPATRTLPVVMLTSSSDDHDLIRSYDDGANAYVPKPVDTDEFLRTAESVGVFWIGLNKRPRVDDSSAAGCG
jgi:two-component system response regulator